MRFEPNPVSTASPTAMPAIRATVTLADAMPNAVLPSASTAAEERGVTVSPKPTPKSDTPIRSVLKGESGTRPDSVTRPTAASPRPTRLRTTIPTTRSANPEARAPTAVASASEPSTRRCSSEPA